MKTRKPVVPVSPADFVKREQAKARRESLEKAMLQQIKGDGLPIPETQVVFSAERRFRADMCWRSDGLRILLDIQGGVWNNGHHSRALNMTDDADKLCLAQVEGWAYLIVTTVSVKDGRALRWIERMIAAQMRAGRAA